MANTKAGRHLRRRRHRPWSGPPVFGFPTRTRFRNRRFSTRPGGDRVMGNTKLISPALLQRHLHKVAYPATRAELIAHARDEYERVAGALEQLPDRRYARPADVSRAFAEAAGAYLGGVVYP